jgi:hypothetical protein
LFAPAGINERQILRPVPLKQLFCSSALCLRKGIVPLFRTSKRGRTRFAAHSNHGRCHVPRSACVPVPPVANCAVRCEYRVAATSSNRDEQVFPMNRVPKSRSQGIRSHGAPGEIRTPDLQLRRLPLYPAELRARISSLHRCTGLRRHNEETGASPARRAERDLETRGCAFSADPTIQLKASDAIGVLDLDHHRRCPRVLL